MGDVEALADLAAAIAAVEPLQCLVLPMFYRLRRSIALGTLMAVVRPVHDALAFVFGKRR